MGIFKRIFQLAKAQIGAAKDEFGKVTPGPQYQAASDEASFKQASPQAAAPPNQEIEFYAYLELKPRADFAQIKAAHRRLLKQYHPDLHSQDLEKQKIAQEICIHLNEALEYFEKKFKIGAQ